MEWDDATVIKLIDLYHLKEILWNPKNRDYKSRPKRYDAFNEIASEFATDVPEIERKIKNLTSHYYREKKKKIIQISLVRVLMIFIIVNGLPTNH